MAGKTSAALDAAVAVPLLIEAFEEIRTHLESRGLLGSGAASSRTFLFRFITTRALASCIRGEAPVGACDYATIRTLWAAQQVGKEHIDPVSTFSRWHDALHSWTEAKKTNRTSDIAGIYDVRVWFFRPNDRGHGARRGVGAGISASISREGRELDIQANPDVTVENPYYRFEVALADDDTHLRTEISRVLTVVRQALRQLPARIVRLLAENPGRLTVDDTVTWWQMLAKAAKQASVVVISLLGFGVAFCALPPKVQTKIFLGLTYAVRPVKWTGDRPDLYLWPAHQELKDRVDAHLGTAKPGETLRDPVTQTSFEVEQVNGGSRWVRLRIEPAPRFRSNRTKYYVDFGERPNRPGSDVIAFGPAMSVEHEFAAPGVYDVSVGIAVDELTEEQRQFVPERYPVDEAWGWVLKGVVSAKVDLRP
jgi:hypothetical protein